MSYNLSTVPKIDDLLYASDNRKELAKSLNLKYTLWRHTSGENYHILKYNKEWISFDTVKTVGLLRSLIYKDDGTVVCMAPPKSLANGDSLSIEENKTYIAETFVEGTMINMFYDKTLNCYEIATRSSVGGNLSFYMEGGFDKSCTFKSMFDDVCNHVGFDYKNFSETNKNLVYSFVMQHPKNRIVKVIKEMKLYLVDVFEIVDNKTINIVDFRKQVLNLPEGIKYPKQEVIADDEGLKQCKETTASMNTPYYIQGVVIKTSDGDRYKIRNPNYEQVRRLRGNQPKLQYQYFVLRQEGKVKEYLEYYKEHKGQFENFRKGLHDYTNQLFENYRRCYIKKERELKSFPEKYRVHMYTLHHEVYLKKLMPENNFVNRDVVINYMNVIHPAKLMYVLNYDMRKNNMDTIQSEENIEDVVA
jgi:hypothetical protein